MPQKRFAPKSIVGKPGKSCSLPLLKNPGIPQKVFYLLKNFTIIEFQFHNSWESLGFLRKKSLLQPVLKMCSPLLSEKKFWPSKKGTETLLKRGHGVFNSGWPQKKTVAVQKKKPHQKNIWGFFEDPKKFDSKPAQKRGTSLVPPHSIKFGRDH